MDVSLKRLRHRIGDFVSGMMSLEVNFFGHDIQNGGKINRKSTGNQQEIKKIFHIYHPC